MQLLPQSLSEKVLREEIVQTPCALCGGAMRRWMRVPVDYRKGKANPHGHLYRCETCVYGAVQPIPNAADIPSFYELERYYTHGTSHFAPDGRISLLDRVRIHLAWRLDRGTPTDATLIDRALGSRPASICDIGCGGGELLRALQERGHRVVGVEPDEQALSLHSDTLEVYAGAAEDLPSEVASRRFDCVVMSHVLEHCRDPVRALRNARSILAPGGKLVCEVPNNAAAALGHVGCAWDMLDVPRHLHFFTAHSLRRACQVSGFRPESVHYAYYTRQFTNGWIATEGQLWDNMMRVDDQTDPLPARNSRVRAWMLLLQTLAARRERKYDSVGLIATAV